MVNYDLPKSIDEYVHRIGRTGRLGNTGRATSFFDTQQDSGLAGDLVRVLADSQQVQCNGCSQVGSGAIGPLKKCALCFFTNSRLPFNTLKQTLPEALRQFSNSYYIALECAKLAGG